MNKVIQTRTREPARIERFQSLQPGRYWRAREAIVEEHISEGMVLLLQSLRYAEDIPHTVVLRPHPSLIGQSVQVPVSKDDVRGGYLVKTLQEHRFLVEDFLRLFEYEPDSQAVRAQEVKAVQAKIAALQNELLTAQADPGRLQVIAQEELAKQTPRIAQQDDAECAESPAAQSPAGALLVASSDSALQGLSDVSLSDALQSQLSEESLNTLSLSAEHEYKVATLKANWIKDKTAKIAETLQELTPFFEEQAAAALAQTEDVRVYVDGLKKGIQSLDLYIGKGVEVETLCKGASAPAEVPLTLVQKKLLMDEELALWVDVDESFDFEDESKFFSALRAHKDLVEQIFPTERCVLLMAVTNRHIDYKDPWVTAAKNQENKKVFLLARDGENIYRIVSSVEGHLGSARLFPSADEQAQIFKGFDGRSIKFKDVVYTDKLSMHEKHALHYKRFLILLAGLDHRLKLFGKFYPHEDSFDFVSIDFQHKYLRFLFDEDKHVLGESRPPLKEWLAQKNSYLHAGSRVLCYWQGLLSERTAPGAGSLSGYGRYGQRFSVHYRPKHDYDICKVQHSAGQFVVSIEVSGYSLSSPKERSFNCKVNLSKFDDEYDETLAYLCLDAVTPEELTWYLHNHKSRERHILYIRFFKRAVQALNEERVEEKRAREALRSALLEWGVKENKEAEQLINKATLAWRAARQGAPLPSPEGLNSSEWNGLVSQLKALLAGSAPLADKLSILCQKQGLTALRLVLAGDGQSVLYAAPSAREEDNRLVPHAWVHRITVKTLKTGLSLKDKRWVRLPARLAAETTLHEWPEAGAWENRSTFFLSPADKAKRLEAVKAYPERLSVFKETMSEPVFEKYFEAWKSIRNEATLHSKLVVNPLFAVPIGVGYQKNKNTVWYVCVRIRNPHTLLYKLAPSDSHKNQIKNAYCAAYRDKISARKSFDWQTAEGAHFELALTGITLEERAQGGFFVPNKLLKERSLDFGESPDLRISSNLSALKKTYPDLCFWFPEPLSALGASVDLCLGLELPADYAPYKLFQIEVAKNNDASTLRYFNWFDLVPLEFDSADYTAIKNHGYRSSKTLAVNRKEALEKMTAMLKRDYGDETEYELKPAKDCEGAPEAPEGVEERWFIVAKA